MNYQDQTDERLQAGLKELGELIQELKGELKRTEDIKAAFLNELKLREPAQCSRCKEHQTVRDLGVDGVCSDCHSEED